MNILRSLFYGCILFICLSCGKVAEDISTQSEHSIFKQAVIVIPLSEFSDTNLNDRLSTSNVVSHYSYLSGISLDKGQEKVGWVESETTVSGIGTNNVYKLVNFDSKKNTVTNARYQQGLISIAKVGTTDVNIQSTFKKIRPKYDFFAFSHYLSKDDAIFYIMSEIPTKSVTINRYDHLISAIYLKHIQDESYSEESIIPFDTFTAIVPTAAVGPTLNIYAENTTRFFRIDQPTFQLDSGLYDALLGIVTLSYHSDEIDVKDYIKAQDIKILTKPMKAVLESSVNRYYSTKAASVTTAVEVIDTQ